MRTSGIYKVTNNITGKVYIGSTTRLEEREKDHLYFFKTLKHENRNIQEDIEKYGGECFSFVVLEVMNTTNKKELEAREREYLAPYLDNCYNSIVVDEKGNWSLSKKNREIMRDLNLGDKNPGFGKPAWNRGITHSEETKKKLSERDRGMPTFIAVEKKTGRVLGRWNNQVKCAKELGIIGLNINCCLKGRQKSSKGYIFKYEGEEDATK